MKNKKSVLSKVAVSRISSDKSRKDRQRVNVLSMRRILACGIKGVIREWLGLLGEMSVPVVTMATAFPSSVNVFI